MHVNRALLDEDVVAPDFVEQLSARMHPLGVCHEEVQQTEFGRPQIERLVATLHPARARIEAQAGDLDPVGACLWRPTPQHGVDSGLEFARRERFGQVIVRPGIEPGHLVALFAARRQQDDRQLARARLGTQAPGVFDPAHPRQHPVEDHEVGQGIVHQSLRLLRAFGEDGTVPDAAQAGGDEFEDRRFVLDDQDGGRHGKAPSRARGNARGWRAVYYAPITDW